MRFDAISRRASLAAAAVGVLTLSLWTPRPAAGGTFLTRDEALELAFPGCGVDRETVYLTRDERRRAADLAGARVDSRLVVRYRSDCGGIAYFDVHRVRTLAATLMVVVDAEGRVARLEVMSFLEPEEYIPRRRWYDQFLGRRIDSKLRLKRSIHAVTGATLTARATTNAVRRILALDRVLGEEPFRNGDLVP